MRFARIIGGALLTLACLAILVTPPAHADSLDNAKRAGLIGETARGYVAPVQAPTPAITQLVNEINAQRRAKYEEIAQKHGTPLGDVEQLVGKRQIERAPAGTYILDSTGNWVRK